MFRLLLVVTVLSLAFPAASRAERKCHRCSEAPACCKVCRVVCEYKDVKQTKWCCKVEDVCLPGPAKRCHHQGDCGCAVQVPTPGKIITRKRLIRVEYTKRVPVYRLVVEYLCSECKNRCGHSAEAPQLPAPPKAKTASAAGFAARKLASGRRK